MANFTYTRDIPNTPNNPSADQPKMKINNNNIDDLIAVDHIEFNENNGGTHKQVQIQKQQTTVNGVIPAGLIGTGFDTIYCSTTAGVDELWFVRNALGTGIQLTGPATPTVVSSTNGYTFLPGGLLLQWGSKNNGGSSSVSFNIPFPTAVFNVSVSPFWNGTAPSGSSNFIVRKDNLSTSSFTWLFVGSSSHYDGFYWYAIGN